MGVYKTICLKIENIFNNRLKINKTLIDNFLKLMLKTYLSSYKAFAL